MKLSLFRFFSFVSLIPLMLVLVAYQVIPLMFAMFNVNEDFTVYYVPRIVIVLFSWLPVLVFFLRVRFTSYSIYILKLMILEQVTLFLLFLAMLFAGMGRNDFVIDCVVFILMVYVFFRTLISFSDEYVGFKRSQIRLVTQFYFNVTCFEVIVLFGGFSMIKNDMYLIVFALLVIWVFWLLKHYFYRGIKNEVS